MKSVLNLLETFTIGTLLGVVLIHGYGKTPTGIEEIDNLYHWFVLPSLFIFIKAGFSYAGIPMFSQPSGHFDLLPNCGIWLMCVFPVVVCEFPIVVVYGLNWPPEIVDLDWPPHVIYDFYWMTLATLASYHLTIWQYLRNVERFPSKTL